MKKNYAVISYIIIPALLIVSCLAGGCSRANASTGGFDPRHGLVVKGNVECAEVDLNTKIAGKIARVFVEEGQTVDAGDLIAEIDNSQLLAKKAQVEAQVKMAKDAVELQKKIADANIEQATGAYQAAQAQLEKAQSGARSQELEQAKAYYEMMEKTYQRVKNLHEKGAIPTQKKDEVETQLKVAKEQYSLAQEGARTQDIAAAQGLASQAAGALSAANAGKMQVQLAEEKYQEALAGLEEINSLINDTKIIAPKNGTVVELNCQEGELVSTGMPLAVIADLANPTIKLSIFETDLSQITIGQKVKIRFNSTGDKTFDGTVKRISAKPHFAAQSATNNEEDDILAYEVKVDLGDLGGEQVYPGMTAYVQFTARS
ncbi:MAG: HlyD family secretion protein [Bacillota bacterium]|jgi:HlyD family secretion protein